LEVRQNFNAIRGRFNIWYTEHQQWLLMVWTYI
jgi:hypothetical protein